MRKLTTVLTLLLTLTVSMVWAQDKCPCSNCPLAALGEKPEFQPLFGAALENADFPEGAWTMTAEGELQPSQDREIWTKEKYGSFICSFEFKLSEHANSGFLFQCHDKGNWIPNTIEIQLHDDYGQEPNYHSCGAIYGFQAPSKNMVKPAGEWNEMTVICFGREITVILNGEVINRMNTAEWVDNAKGPNGTDIEKKFHGHSLASIEPYGYIGFQGVHGNSPVAFRNARIIPIRVNPDTSDWTYLFGEKLEDAEFDPDVWSIDAEGVLHATRDEMIWSKEKYGDCVIDLEVMNSKDSNSGVVIQCSDKANWIPNALEIQVYDSFEHNPVDMSSFGAVYGRCGPVINMTKAPGEWNRMTVITLGKMIYVAINGEIVTIMDKSLWIQADKNPDGTDVFSWLINKAPAETANEGYVGLQGLHQGVPVVYRNVKIKSL